MFILARPPITHEVIGGLDIRYIHYGNNKSG